MQNSRCRILRVVYSTLWILTLIVERKSATSVSAASVNEANGGVQDGRSQFCNIDLASFLPPPYGNLSYLSCKNVWETFVLRYYQSNENTVTFVLSSLYTGGWVGIGFSNDGTMVGGSAMVGWISKTGHAKIKQYFLKGRTSSEVEPGKGNLNLTSIPPVVVIDGANIYLGFQLQFNAPLAQQPTLLAYGRRVPFNHKLAMHDDKTTIRIDYTARTAASDSAGGGSGGYGKMKRSHGILGILGWGFFLPTGALVARFLKRKEPLWYYLHTVIQFTGFFIALAGIVVGQALYNHMHAEVAAHRGIGYFAFTLSVLQVLAFFIRPDRQNKIRGLWAAYHRWFGVITLFFGALNVALGIQVGGAGPQWKIGYGFLLGTLIATTIVLQVLSMIRNPEKTTQPSISTFQMS